MIKIKILDILEKLSPDELKDFSDYLNSPLFNKRKIITELFGLYKKYYPLFNDASFTKEKIFSKLFPKKSYNDTVFRNLNSILLSHAENFLSLKNYLKDPVLKNIHLLSELNTKNIFSLSDKNFREGINQLERSEVRDSEFYLNEYNLYLQKDLYNSFVNKFSKDDITSSGMSFMKFYIMKLMEIQNYILYECRILGLDNTLFIDADYIDKTLKIMPASIRDMPQVKIYYNALMLERKQSEKYYNELKTLLFEFGNLLEKEKLYNKYIDLIDFIKRSRRSNDLGSLREIFLLRKRIVENGLMPENFITNMFFLNLVSSALRLEEFDWTFEFIEKYNMHLLPDHRDSVRNLSYSLYYFNKKDFQKALSYSAKVGYEDNYYNLQVKNIMARIYFELDETNPLISHIASYRMYLAKNRTLSKKEVTSHSLFINFIDKLFKVREKKKLYKLSDIISKAGKTEFISRNWIIEKANELDK